MPRRRLRPILALSVLAAALSLAAGLRAQSTTADRCVVPASIREPILNEVSGEQAFLHVQFLAANRDRQPEEYQNAVLRDHLHPRHGQAGGPVRRAGGLLSERRRVGRRGRRPVAGAAAEGEDREPEPGADRARARQPERGRRDRGGLRRAGARRGLRRQGREREDRARQRVAEGGVLRRGAARSGRRARNRQSGDQQPGPGRVGGSDRVGVHLAGGQHRRVSGSRSRSASSCNCGTCSTAGRRS